MVAAIESAWIQGTDSIPRIGLATRLDFAVGKLHCESIFSALLKVAWKWNLYGERRNHNQTILFVTTTECKAPGTKSMQVVAITENLVLSLSCSHHYEMS